MTYQTEQDEKFNDFIKKWRRNQTYGWTFIKWLMAGLVLGALFFISVWGTTQQKGLMPGGTIGGEAKKTIGGGGLKDLKSIR